MDRKVTMGIKVTLAVLEWLVPGETSERRVQEATRATLDPLVLLVSVVLQVMQVCEARQA